MPVKLRIPDAWEGRIHSEEVRYMLQGWFQRPCPLPPDPGAGRARVSLNLPPRAVKVLEGLTGESPSVGLRRLIVAHVPTLPAPFVGRPMAALPEPRQARFASFPAQGSALVTRPAWPARGQLVPVVPLRPVKAEDIAGQVQELVSFWFWIAVAAGALWLLWKFFGKSMEAVAESVSVAEELPRFAQWIPKGL